MDGWFVENALMSHLRDLNFLSILVYWPVDI